MIIDQIFKRKLSTKLKNELKNDILDEYRANKKCSLGVGCGETGVCYAKANGNPEMCGIQNDK